jgi:phage shock protein PspC (stress-responsive transcriptional regulator)
MPFCAACGKEYEEGAAYCSKCGKPVGTRKGGLEEGLDNFGREMDELGKKISQGFGSNDPDAGGMEQAFGPLAPLIFSIISILVIVIGIGAFALLVNGNAKLQPIVDLLWSSAPLFFALLLFFSYCGYIVRHAKQEVAWLRPIMGAVAAGAVIWFAFRLLAALDQGFSWNLPAWLDWLGYIIAGLVFLALFMVGLLAAVSAAQTRPSTAPSGDQAVPQDGVKRLYRSNDERWVAGVCSGLGEYFGIDPVLVRVLWIILSLASLGIGVVGYLLLWIVIPRDPRQQRPA